MACGRVHLIEVNLYGVGCYMNLVRQSITVHVKQLVFLITVPGAVTICSIGPRVGDAVWLCTEKPRFAET